MSRFLSGLLATVLLALPAAAQPTPADTARAPWALDLKGALSVTQAGSHNWSEGGVSTLALASSLDGKGVRLSPGLQQTYTLRLAIGLVKQDTLALRKADDEIRLAVAVQFTGDGLSRHVNPTLSAGLRTQFAPGYNYDKNPLGTGEKPPVKVSDFASPAVFQAALGLTYQPDGWFKQRVGVGTKETLVLIERLRSLYGVDPAQAVRFELGLESQTEVDRMVFENVRFKSALSLFAAFNRPEMPDLLWHNLVAMRVNSWLSFNVQVTALYDRDRSTALQLKETTALSLAITLL